jgi:hypothetical protein
MWCAHARGAARGLLRPDLSERANRVVSDQVIVVVEGMAGAPEPIPSPVGVQARTPRIPPGARAPTQSARPQAGPQQAARARDRRSAPGSVPPRGLPRWSLRGADRKQFAVLDILVAAEGGVVSAEELLARAWDENADPFTNAVRITVSALRKRLGEPGIIATVAGAGYRISTQPDTQHGGGDRGYAFPSGVSGAARSAGRRCCRQTR